MLVCAHHLVQVGPFPQEALIDAREMIGGAAVDEQAAAGRAEIVAGGTVDCPGLRQVLMDGEDFLHHQIQRPGADLTGIAVTRRHQ